MLPAHRVIGHREYGNRVPGGWAGRKTDPTYDMNWRRSRVANFVPRNQPVPDPGPPSLPLESSMRIVRATDTGHAYIDTGFSFVHLSPDDYRAYMDARYPFSEVTQAQANRMADRSRERGIALAAQSAALVWGVELPEEAGLGPAPAQIWLQHTRIDAAKLGGLLGSVQEHITAEVNRAVGEAVRSIREALAEGYDLRLEPKSDGGGDAPDAP